MRAVDLIRRKRDGGELESRDIEALIRGYTGSEDSAPSIGDDQMAAFCMAVYFRGLTDAETSALVQAMLRSGDVLDLSSIPGRKVDKHSTGGVGDKISLCLAPLVAACGVPVPMISGRGLGHTGGTLDKLAAIPGFSTNLSVEAFRNTVEVHRLSFIGQTERLAPADKRLYALRDVTATVESIPLIAASIMSKKLAEGIDALVLDVKVGSGAFMKTEAEARTLAEALTRTGLEARKPTRALLSNMDQVLGRAVGNANETWEAIEVLQGGGPNDVRELTLELGAEMLVLGGVAGDLPGARARLESALEDGSGFETFSRVVHAQGGEVSALVARSKLPFAPDESVLAFQRSGYVASVDVEAVGLAAMRLGAGRTRQNDPVDLGVGLLMQATVGDYVQAGDPLAVIRHRSGRGVLSAERTLLDAFLLAEEAPPSMPLILGRLGGGAVGRKGTTDA